MRDVRVVLAGLLLLTLALLAHGQSVPDDPVERAERERETNQSLERLRRDVNDLKNALAEGRRAESKAVAAVADAERAVSDQGRALAELTEQGEQLRQDLEQIGERQQVVKTEIDRQRVALGHLLRLDYVRGRQSAVRLLLDSEHATGLTRGLGYSHLLQRDRVRTIEQHAASLAELARLADERAQALDALSQQRVAEERQAQALMDAVAHREQALAVLRDDLAGHQQRLSALAADEQALVRLLEQLRDIFADLPDTLEGAQPFRSLRGRLPWPVAGTASSGGNGGLRIAAEAGADVMAVAHGRVAFADWLRGYGLLLIVDHGDGYMSLYGHNDTLLKREGAWVQAGERIATVGRSGGELQPLLYFELRERGRSIAARPWLRRR